jgi:hypothetical protein
VLSYELTNTREEAVTVDGLDVLPPKSTVSFTADQAGGFHFARGLQLTNANVPRGVRVCVVVTSDKEETE